MTEEKRFCAVPTCGQQISPQYLMCFAHWRLLPAAMQRLVNTAWRRFNQRGDGWNEYRELRQDAIEAVSNHARCLISGCEAPGRKFRPICTAHWDLLPQKLRLEILAAIKETSTPMELHIARSAANAHVKSAMGPRP